MKNLKYPFVLLLISSLISCVNLTNKTSSNHLSNNREKGETDLKNAPTEPGYFPQWFEKHKNEQGVIPDGLTAKWYAHDQAQAPQPEGESPILSIENLAKTTLQAGRTRAVLIDITDANKMLAGCVSGGLWRSTDGGANWSAINDAASTLSVTCLVQNPLKTNEIYYGTGETRGASQGVSGDGVFKSTDGGLTFARLASSSNDMRNCNYMSHSPTDSNTVYVGTPSGLYISTNGGGVWTKILAGANNGVIEHPDGKILATVQGVTATSGIFKATTGSNFVKAVNPTFPTSNVARILIANCKAFPNVVYALFCGADYALEGNLGVFKSSDFGTNWRRMDTDSTANRTIGTSYQAYCQLLSAHPTDSNRIVLGALGMKKSNDGGLTYISVAYGHADNHTVVPIPDTDNFLIGSDGGVHRASWSGATATQPLNNGYTTFQFYAGNYAPRGKICVGGTQDNGTWRYLTTLARASQGGDGGYCHISQQDSSLAYFSFQNGITTRSTAFVTSGGGTTITPPTAVAEGVDFINEFQINYTDGNQLYYRTNKALHRTTNRGANWTRMNTADIGRIQAVGVSNAVNPNVYVGGNGIFYRFDSAATSTSPSNFVDLRATVPVAVNAFSWGTIAVHPSVNSTLYVGMTTTSPQPRAWRLLYANTDTIKWENITGDLAASLPIYQIQSHPDKPDSLLFAATAFGLYVSSNNGRNWVKDTRIPNVPIFEMKLRKSDRTLFLFTHGRGIWYIQLQDYTNGGGVTSTAETEKLSVSIYPNPASDVLNIDTKGPLSIAQVFDLNGREIMTVLNPVNSIKINDLKSGFYLIKLFDTQGRFITRKFVKQ